MILQKTHKRVTADTITIHRNTITHNARRQQEEVAI